MNIFQKYFNRNKQAIQNRSGTFGVGGTIAPNRDQEGLLQAYNSVGWWHAVNFRIALGISEVKWTLFDTVNQSKPKQIFNHKVLDLLHLINPIQTSNEFFALDSIYMESIGESFWVLNYNGLDEPAEMILPYPHKMSVVPDKSFPYVKGYVYGTGQDAIPFNANEVIHFKYPNPLNQYRGLGQAQAIGINLDAQENADKWVSQFFYNSARPDGVLQYDYALSDEQFDRLKKEWNEKYRGVNKAHQVALLDNGGKYVQVQNSVKDMDFSNLQLRNRDILLGVMGMPLSVMGISENVNKANAESGEYVFARWVIKPRLEWKKAKIQEQLIPKFKNSQNLQISYEEIVPETVEQKNLLAKEGVMSGMIRIDEARKLRGEDPVGGEYGNSFLVPQNYSVITADGKVLFSANQQGANQNNSPSDNVAPSKETPQKPIVEPVKSIKGLTPEAKKVKWEAYAKRTDKQEEIFKGVFSRVFKEQGKEIVTHFEKSGNLPELKDEETAKKFQPAIKDVYENSFKEAL